MMSNIELEEIQVRWLNTQPGPWKAFIEGRDHEAGGDFIMTGDDINRGDDIELFGATVGDYDFIANAKQDIPKLLNEIKELRKLIGKRV